MGVGDDDLQREMGYEKELQMCPMRQNKSGMDMNANDCKCVECGKPAVAFWPIIDPDIPALPYCRRCLDKAKAEVLVHGFGYSEKEARAFIKIENKLKEKK